MAEELQVELKVEAEDGKLQLDDFATRLAAVTAGVAMLQETLAGDPKDDPTFGKKARTKVKDYGKEVDEADAKLKRFRERRGRRSKRGGAFSAEAIKEVNDVSQAIDGLTDSTEEYIKTIEDAESGATLFEQDIVDDVEAMRESIETLKTSTDEAITALSDEGFAFKASDTPAEVEQVNEKLVTLEALVESTKEKLATATDNQAFGADVRDEIAMLEETLTEAESAIVETKEKIAEGPKGPFPLKVTEQMEDLGGVLGDLLPRNLKQMQRGFKQATRGTGSFTKGLKGMKKALISTGIGALVVLLGELVANWDNITSAINSASDESQNLLDSANGMREQADEQYKAIEATTNQMLLQGKTEEEISAMKEKALDDQIIAAELQLQYTKAQAKEQQETIERNKKIAMGVLAALESPVVLLLGVIDAVTEAMASAGLISEKSTLATDFLAKQAEMLGFDTEEAAKENEERISKAEEELNRLVEKRAANEVNRRKREQAEAEKQRQANEKLLEERRKFLDQLLIEEQEAGKSQDELAQMRLKREQDAQMQRARDLNLSQEELQRLEAQHQAEMTALVEQQEKRRADIVEQEQQRVKNATMSDEDLRIAQTNKEYDELIALAEKYGMDTAELERRREAELRQIRLQAHEDEVGDVEALRRELELLNMTASQAEFEQRRDRAKQQMEERLATAAGDLELEKMIREQFRVEMEVIDNAERDNYVDTRMEMFDSAMGFANNLKGVYNSINDLVRANMEAELLAAEERGASEEELEQIEAQHAEREKRMAITNVLLQQGQAIASAIAGAAQASAATGPLAPFVLPAYIATAVGSIIAGFAQVKNIMNQAKAATLSSTSTSSGGSGPSATRALPALVDDLGNDDVGQRDTEDSFKTYVVASDVQGQNKDYGDIVQNASL